MTPSRMKSTTLMKERENSSQVGIARGSQDCIQLTPMAEHGADGSPPAGRYPHHHLIEGSTPILAGVMIPTWGA
jgi:hypothetical protein